MHIVFASIPAYGHVYPLLPLATACAEAGHQVVIATGDPFVGRLKLPTVMGFPVDVQLDSVVEETKRRHPAAEGLDLTVAMFADTTAERVIATLLPILRDTGPDLVIYEAMNIGAGIAASALDIPSAAFSIGMAHGLVEYIHTAALNYHRTAWTTLDQPVPADTTSFAGVLIDPTPPALHLYSGSDVGRLPIRPVAFVESGGVLPGWLTEPAGRPRVYLTLGTVSFGAVDVLRRAASEIARLDVDVLVAAGPTGDPGALGEVADNVHVERFVDQATVLGLVDLAVHHGGYGTVLGALAAGLPQLLLPQGADQFHNATSLSAYGAARMLLADDQLPGAIGNAAAGLLAADAPERAVIRALHSEIEALPAPADVVPALVGLVDGWTRRSAITGSGSAHRR